MMIMKRKKTTTAGGSDLVLNTTDSTDSCTLSPSPTTTTIKPPRDINTNRNLSYEQPSTTPLHHQQQQQKQQQQQQPPRGRSWSWKQQQPYHYQRQQEQQQHLVEPPLPSPLAAATSPLSPLSSSSAGEDDNKIATPATTGSSSSSLSSKARQFRRTSRHRAMLARRQRNSATARCSTNSNGNNTSNNGSSYRLEVVDEEEGQPSRQNDDGDDDNDTSNDDNHHRQQQQKHQTIGFPSRYQPRQHHHNQRAVVVTTNDVKEKGRTHNKEEENENNYNFRDDDVAVTDSPSSPPSSPSSIAAKRFETPTPSSPSSPSPPSLHKHSANNDVIPATKPARSLRKIFERESVQQQQSQQQRVMQQQRMVSQHKEQQQEDKTEKRLAVVSDAKNNDNYQDHDDDENDKENEEDKGQQQQQPYQGEEQGKQRISSSVQNLLNAYKGSKNFINGSIINRRNNNCVHDRDNANTNATDHDDVKHGMVSQNKKGDQQQERRAVIANTPLSSLRLPHHHMGRRGIMETNSSQSEDDGDRNCNRNQHAIEQQQKQQKQQMQQKQQKQQKQQWWIEMEDRVDRYHRSVLSTSNIDDDNNDSLRLAYEKFATNQNLLNRVMAVSLYRGMSMTKEKYDHEIEKMKRHHEQILEDTKRAHARELEDLSSRITTDMDQAAAAADCSSVVAPSSAGMASYHSSEYQHQHRNEAFRERWRNRMSNNNQHDEDRTYSAHSADATTDAASTVLSTMSSAVVAPSSAGMASHHNSQYQHQNRNEAFRQRWRNRMSNNSQDGEDGTYSVHSADTKTDVASTVLSNMSCRDLSIDRYRAQLLKKMNNNQDDDDGTYSAISAGTKTDVASSVLSNTSCRELSIDRYRAQILKKMNQNNNSKPTIQDGTPSGYNNRIVDEDGDKRKNINANDEDNDDDRCMNDKNAKGDTEEIQRLLDELQQSERRQKLLEKQLQQAGVVLAEDIPYQLAKDKVASISKRMNEIGSSNVTHDDPIIQKSLRQEYFNLEKDMQKYMTALSLTDEYVEEEQRKEEEWEVSIVQENIRALRAIRSYMPVNIRRMTNEQLSQDWSGDSCSGLFLSQDMIKRFRRTNVLQLLRVDPITISKWHPSRLEAYCVTGLSLTERRALHHHLLPVGKLFSNNSSGGGGDLMTNRKLAWYQTMKTNFREALNRYERHVAESGDRCSTDPNHHSRNSAIDYFNNDGGLGFFPMDDVYEDPMTIVASDDRKSQQKTPAEIIAAARMGDEQQLQKSMLTRTIIPRQNSKLTVPTILPNPTTSKKSPSSNADETLLGRKGSTDSPTGAAVKPKPLGLLAAIVARRID